MISCKDNQINLKICEVEEIVDFEHIDNIDEEINIKLKNQEENNEQHLLLDILEPSNEV